MPSPSTILSNWTISSLRMLRTKLSIKKANRGNQSQVTANHIQSTTDIGPLKVLILLERSIPGTSKLGILPLAETTSIQNDRPAIISVVTKTKIHHSLCTIGIVKQIILLTVLFFWYDSCPLDKPWAERIWGKMITSCPWQNTQTIYWPLSLITVPWCPFW